MPREEVILVDKDGNRVGVEEKMCVHENGLLHRAFSVFIFRDKGGIVEVLLQKRVNSKYHSGGLWSNTCCSHPRPGESVLEAAHRRLKEEMGLDYRSGGRFSSLKEKFSFIYKVSFDNGLIEYEYDHVLCGNYDKEVIEVNPNEVSSCRWVSWDFLCEDVVSRPELYTYWLREIIFILKRDEKEKMFYECE